MIDQHKKNKILIIVIMAMTIIPFSYAWYLSSNAKLLGKGTNNGELIIPPITTESSEFIGFDDFSAKNMQELKGRWVLINLIPEATCNEFCQEAIHKTQQLRLMMNKDLTRLRRLVLLVPEISSDKAQQWWKDDIRLLRSKPAASLLDKIKKLRNGVIPEGMLILMDPLGNLMMQYEPKFDPYEVKSDLQKLLKISQIG